MTIAIDYKSLKYVKFVVDISTWHVTHLHIRMYHTWTIEYHKISSYIIFSIEYVPCKILFPFYNR